MAKKKATKKRPSKDQQLEILRQELCRQRTFVESPHPAEQEIKDWLKDDRVKGKFDRRWHQRLSTAVGLHILVSPELHKLALRFDQLFPTTTNTFNPFTDRPPVTEPVLLDYLQRNHGISNHDAEQLTIEALNDILQDDVRQKNASGATYLGNGKIQIGVDLPIQLTTTEDDVVRIIVKEGGVAELRQLPNGAPRILKNMQSKYPQMRISLPGGKGKGGYAIAIRDGRKPATASA